MTELLRVDPDHPDAAAVARAAERLKAGGLVAFPTETVYGLGAHALDRDAVRRLFAAKGRPATDPLIVHVGGLDDAGVLVAGMPAAAQRLASRFWPGPLTLVLRRSPVVPDEVTAGLATVAVRAPSHPVARALLDAAGIPIAAPSANLFSRPSPTRAEHVLQDLDGRIDIVVDGGPTPVGVESTVLDLTGPEPIVLRPGAVTPEMLRAVLPGVRVRSAAARQGVAAPSPGLLERHYAPRAPLTLYEGDADRVLARLAGDARAEATGGRRVGLILADDDRLHAALHHLPPHIDVVTVGPAANLAAVASRLYAALRELDAAGVDMILARGFPADTGLGLALQDRLRRAAGRIVRV
ncbi:MAG TPA: L-threonylcarbamoyladenylate synthase [Vicinamibacterales bacterium]|nr:L-threonylcarbamoyladenylate synthase [Vicinamibacterales bacterium]